MFTMMGCTPCAATYFKAAPLKEACDKAKTAADCAAAAGPQAAPVPERSF
jgi:hypothetical protein